MLRISGNLFETGISTVPWIQDDESLYSWYANLHLLNGFSTAVRTSQGLFETPYAALAHDIPSHISSLARHELPFGDDLVGFASKHSLLGYYLPWLGDERTEIVLSHVLSGAPKDVKMHLGLPASRLGALHPLKACRTCIRSDIETYGRAYWHTDHQYPSVWLCTHHLSPLLHLDLPKSPRHYREWFSPDRIKPSMWRTSRILGCGDESPIFKLANTSLRIARESKRRFHPGKLTWAYQEALRDRGLFTAGRSLRRARITASIHSYYAGLRQIPGFRILDSLTDEWGGFVGTLARQQPRDAHPFKHLLVIAWLFSDCDEFFTAYDEAVAPQLETQSPEVGDRDNSRQKSFVDLVQNAGLSLSAAGRRVGISATTAVRWAKLNNIAFTPRTKKMSPTVVAHCRALLSAGEPRAAVARKTGLSTTTLTRLLSSEPALKQARQDSIFKQRQQQSRTRFLTLLEAHPGVPVKLLRKIPENGYAWLYRNDRQWLIKHLPMIS